MTKPSRLVQSYTPSAVLICAQPVAVSQRRRPPNGTVGQGRLLLPMCRSMKSLGTDLPNPNCAFGEVASGTGWEQFAPVPRPPGTSSSPSTAGRGI